MFAEMEEEVTLAKDLGLWLMRSLKDELKEANLHGAIGVMILPSKNCTSFQEAFEAQNERGGVIPVLGTVGSYVDYFPEEGVVENYLGVVGEKLAKMVRTGRDNYLTPVCEIDGMLISHSQTTQYWGENDFHGGKVFSCDDRFIVLIALGINEPQRSDAIISKMASFYLFKPYEVEKVY